MVLLLNILVPLVAIVLIVLTVKLRKMWPTYTMIALSIIYAFAQPSYMPKGTVKPMPTIEFKQLDIPMVDRSLKPKSDAERDSERKAAIEEIDRDLEQQIIKQQMKYHKE